MLPALFNLVWNTQKSKWTVFFNAFFLFVIIIIMIVFSFFIIFILLHRDVDF